MFRTVPLSIIRSFSLYTQQWYMSYRFADSWRAGSGRNSVLILLTSCMTYTIAVCTYSEKLLIIKCIYATLGICYSVWMTVWCAGAFAPSYQIQM